MVVPSQDTAGELVEGGADFQAQAGQVLQAFAAALAQSNGQVNGLEGHGNNDPHNLLGGTADTVPVLAQQPAPAPPAATSTKGNKTKPPRPDTIEPCPRCGSNDTKFCYYNNYNIKQPRFFCKSCQRYWTAGGTLRNVPPGSGRRKSKSQANKEDKQQAKQSQSQSLADMTSQSVASAMLSSPASLAASVPYLNPMLTAADSTLFAYNAAAAQQSLLGSAALSALAAKMPGAWPMNGATNGDTQTLTSPHMNGGSSSNLGAQAASNSGDDHDDGAHPAKRAKLDTPPLKSEDPASPLATAAVPSSSVGATTTPLGAGGAADDGTTANTTSPSNGMINMSHAVSNGNNGNGMGMLQNSMSMGLGGSWPGLGTSDLTGGYLNSMTQADPTGMMGNKSGQQAAAAVAQNAAVAAQSALQQQQMAYQHMLQAHLGYQQLAAAQQVAAAGLGQASPYLSLPHLAAFNPYYSAAAAAAASNPAALANLGFNPGAGR